MEKDWRFLSSVHKMLKHQIGYHSIQYYFGYKNNLIVKNHTRKCRILFSKLKCKREGSFSVQSDYN